LSGAAGFGFLAGAAGALAAWEFAGRAGTALSRRAPAVVGGATALVDALVRLGSEGRDPRARERRRLLLAGAVTAFLGGTAVLGLLSGLALAAAGPWTVARLLRTRRERYRRAVDAGVAQMAVAIADAIAGGHSLRGALEESARSVHGAAGHELRRAAAELAAGATTHSALESMRARVASARLDMLVAACLLQRRAGGDLARLLRESARAMEEQARLEGEVRTATAQARFTGLLVALLPLGGALLAELASPGWFAGLWSSFLTVWLVGLALILQLAAVVLMRRLGRVRC
jgi:tight adherence protein B